MTTYSAILTTAGEALYAASVVSGVPIQLATMAVGDGGGNPVITPDPTRTALVNQVYSGPVNSLTTDAADPTLLWAEFLLASAAGGWTIREVGIFTESGTLFAIANFPDTYKPVITDGSTRDLVINFGLKASNTALITLIIDPSIVGATRAWVLSTITPAYLFPGGSQYQILQKNSAMPGDIGWANPGSPWETVINTTGGVIVLTTLQAMSQIIVVNGSLTQNATLIFPATFGKWTIVNHTAGAAYSLTAITVDGTGVPIAQGNADTVYCDGINVHYAVTSTLTRAANDGSTATATTEYVDRAVSDIGGYYIDTGTANAYVITTVPATLAYANGLSFRFRVGNTNTAACTLNAGAGPQPMVRDDGNPLQLGDLPAATLVTVTYSAAIASWIVGSLVYSQFGTAARLNASDQLGGISATQNYPGDPNGFVAGNAANGQLPPSKVWDTVDEIEWACITTGSAATARWARVSALAGQWGYVCTSCTLFPGMWKLDSSAGPFTITLQASSVPGDNYTFDDIAGTWGTHPVTIDSGANPINDSSNTFVLNVPYSQCSLNFIAGNWTYQ